MIARPAVGRRKANAMFQEINKMGDTLSQESIPHPELVEACGKLASLTERMRSEGWEVLRFARKREIEEKRPCDSLTGVLARGFRLVAVKDDSGAWFDEDGNHAPSRVGIIVEESGESWVKWAVFNREQMTEFLRQHLDDSNDVDPEDTTCPTCGEYMSLDWDTGRMRCQMLNCREEFPTKASRSLELAMTLVPWYAHSGGPGRSFASAPSVKVGRNRILVTQLGGLDV